jgi:hypothetical protein
MLANPWGKKILDRNGILYPTLVIVAIAVAMTILTLGMAVML